MNREQILKKAIKKARENGFRLREYIEYPGDILEFSVNKNIYYIIIFSHDFAKAFWGNIWPEEVVGVKGLKGNFPYWQIELQQMVLEEDPVKYLEKFL